MRRGYFFGIPLTSHLGIPSRNFTALPCAHTVSLMDPAVFLLKGIDGPCSGLVVVRPLSIWKGAGIAVV